MVTCPIDQNNFTSAKELSEHMEADHNMSVGSPEMAGLPGGQSNSIFDASAPPVYTPNTMPKPKEKPLKDKAPETEKPEPIVLEYKYTGVCPKCGTPVTTLFIPGAVKKNQNAICFCTSCSKQLQSREVIIL